MSAEPRANPAPAPVGAANPSLLRCRARACHHDVREMIDAAKLALDPLNLTSEEMVSVELVLAEALNNIVEHAYPADAPGEVRMHIRQRGKGVMVEIRDDGKPMPNGRAPIGDHPMTDLAASDEVPEGGFGWFLIREIARDLIYDRADGENFLIFRLAVGGNPT